ncbi:MAG: PAS domain S-box protein [Mycobacterium sp.]|nr:PAS domain S-box protein [Mycobacterium sp.]
MQPSPESHPPEDLLQAADEAALEPHAVLEAVRDADGAVVDFNYREINPVAAAQQQREPADLIGSSLAETLPNVKTSGLLARYAHCVDTGKPLILDDFSYHGRALPGAVPRPELPQLRRYEIRAVRIGEDLISVHWRDVTDLLNTLDAAEQARSLLRAATDALLDPQVLVEPVRDRQDRIVDFIYREVNRAACHYLGLSREQMVGISLLSTLPDLDGSGLFAHFARCIDTGEPVVLDDFPYFNEILDDVRRYDIRAGRVGNSLSVTLRDVTERFDNARRLAESEEQLRLMTENTGDMLVHIRDGRFAWVSPAAEEVLGAPPEYWLGRRVVDFVIPAEDIDQHRERVRRVQAGESFTGRLRNIGFDGRVHWLHFNARPFYDREGRQDGSVVSLRLIDDEVAAEQALAEARRRQADADALFRRSMETSAVGTCLARTDGALLEVNDALCEFFGYDEATLLSKNWIDLTAEDYLEADLGHIAELVAGRIDSYRMTKQFIHADGHRIWGDQFVACVRRSDGDVQTVIGQIIDITEEVEYRERLKAELDSAASYVRTILPKDLDGAVRTSTLYLPSSELSGDCFNFGWIDDDHLMVYLMDVSGHGVESALVSVSVHDFLQPGSLSAETMAAPDSVLAALNERFRMEHHNHHYLTIWYGIYRRSTRTLTYAGAGHPPALVLTGSGRPETLWSQAPPVGMFENAPFTAETRSVGADSQILLYSDGLFDFPVADGGNYGLTEFIDLVADLASATDWSLQDVTGRLASLSLSGQFKDDCSLVRLSFS